MTEALPWVEAVAAIITPLVLAALAFLLARRQDRSAELLRFRIEAYRDVAPDLNRLMCYLTFIGAWKEMTPRHVIELKRRLDGQTACVLPLFSPEVMEAYRSFMSGCSRTFGRWGSDAQLETSAFRRRGHVRRWPADWDEKFAVSDDEPLSDAASLAHRDRYDMVISLLVEDLSIARARQTFTTDLVVQNAHRSPPAGVTASGGDI